MCLKKSKFKELLEDYPDAKKMYMQRAKERRIEFRRVKYNRPINLMFLEDEKTYDENEQWRHHSKP